jgi:glycosyltransferase involved in cell wall biosynthesis
VPRGEVIGLLKAADAAVLTSAWENFPHGVVEALAVGTPVIATRTGGVSEVVQDGDNGLLVEPGDAPAFAAAVRRFLGDESLRERLRAAAAPSVARYDADAIYGRLESLLREAAGR